MNFNISRLLNDVLIASGNAANEARKLSVINNTTCKPKCHSCCSRYVNISVAESILIYNYLSSKMLWSEVKKLALAQAPIAQSSNPLSWFKMNIQCPVLDRHTKLCLAYSVVPIMCSTHYVMSSSELCDPWSSKTNNVVYDVMNVDSIIAEFNEKFQNTVDDNGILKITMPISLCLLLAEKVCSQTDKSLSEIMSVLYNELK